MFSFKIRQDLRFLCTPQMFCIRVIQVHVYGPKHVIVYSELIDGLHVMDDNDNKLASSKVYICRQYIEGSISWITTYCHASTHDPQLTPFGVL